MNRVIDSLEVWTELLQREYPGVRFDHTDNHPLGINAVTAGVLVGRYHSQRDPSFGVG
jgi:hypothetical protein